MHNWLEGILQNHFRFQWEIDLGKQEDQNKKPNQETKLDNNPKRKIIQLENNNPSDDLESDYSEVDDSSDGKFCSKQSGAFDDQRIKDFVLLLSNVVLPSGLPPPPQPFGEKKSW